MLVRGLWGELWLSMNITGELLPWKLWLLRLPVDLVLDLDERLLDELLLDELELDELLELLLLLLLSVVLEPELDELSSEESSDQMLSAPNMMVSTSRSLASRGGETGAVTGAGAAYSGGGTVYMDLSIAWLNSSLGGCGGGVRTLFSLLHWIWTRLCTFGRFEAAFLFGGGGGPVRTLFLLLDLGCSLCSVFLVFSPLSFFSSSSSSLKLSITVGSGSSSRIWSLVRRNRPVSDVIQ